MSKIAKITFNKTGLVVLLQVADDDQTRSVGLMNVSHLNDKSGMIFIFETDDNLSFYMYRTSIPLTILFINRSMRIIDIQNMKPCSYNNPSFCEIYKSREPAKYAIEVNIGFNQKYAINIGDYITINQIYSS